VKVGLVLGAGGVKGGAWLTGGLEALARETGWDPASADYVVGTSAGSMMGSLLAAGVPPWFMVAHSAGEVFDGLVDAEGKPAAEANRSAGAVFRIERGSRLPIGPGSLELGLRSMLRPHRHTPSTVMAGWLPRGLVSPQPLKDTIRRVVPDGWADHPNLWVMACDYKTGRRVPFGREDAPEAELADAVAASCAIPGFYAPVEIDGRAYVDGGMYSVSNLDVLRDEGLDLVICLNPTSSLHPPHAWNPLDRLAAIPRNGAGRRLGAEARKLRARGTEVVLIQPTLEDRRVMGLNLMSTRRQHETIETAIRTVGEQLREPGNADLLSDLPAGEPHRLRRPEGHPSTWPDTIVPGRAVGAATAEGRARTRARERKSA
jgi:NTE family protein